MTLVVPFEKAGQIVVVFGREFLEAGDRDVAVEVVVFRIVNEVGRFLVLDMGGFEADGKAKRLVGRATIQKLERLPAHDLRQVRTARRVVFVEIAALSRKTFE